MKRSAYYDNVKLLLIFLVLLGHFCEITGSNSAYAKAVYFIIYIFHMPLFSFCAGLLCNYRDGRKVYHRCTGYILLYLLMKITEMILVAILYGAWRFDFVNEGGVPWFMLAMSVWILLAYLTKDMNRPVLLVISVLTALALGYDYSMTTQFSISRIIVFWPFFLAGTMMDRDKIQKTAQKKAVKIAGALFLIAAVVLVFLFYRKVSFIRPLLSGKKAYDVLKGRWINYGIVIRFGIYILSTVFSMAIMAIVPLKEHFFTKWGSRTLAVYFLCLPVYLITARYFADLRLWQYLVISAVLIPVCGNSVLNSLLGKLFKQ